MKTEISKNEFIKTMATKENGFSVCGASVLYDEIVNYEEDMGQEIEFDPIAIRSDFTEYEDINDFLKEYNSDIWKSDYTDYDDFKNDFEEWLREKTLLIKLSDDLDDGFIIQNY